MSRQNKLLPALDAEQPRPTLDPSMQGEEKEWEGSADPSQTPSAAVTEALAATSHINGSQPAVTETTDTAVQVKVVATDPASLVDAEGDKKTGQPTQGVSIYGDSQIIGSTTPEIYPPSPREAFLDDIYVKGHEERKVAKSFTADSDEAAIDLGDWPEEASIEDPCICQGIEDEGHVTNKQKKSGDHESIGIALDENATRNQEVDGLAVSPEMRNDPELSDDELTADSCLTAHSAPPVTPGAVAIPGPGISSDNDDMERLDCEHLGEATQEASPPMPTGVHVVEETGQPLGTDDNDRAVELARRQLLSNVPLVSAEAIQDRCQNSDAAPMALKCSQSVRSRRTLAMVAVIIVIIAAAATFIGIFVRPSQKETPVGPVNQQGQQPSAAPSADPTTCSLLPSFYPTSDPEALRVRSIQSILVPISGEETLLNISTPQYRALEWVSLIDPLHLPHETEAQRKRIVQRYILATLYYATGGPNWSKSYHFLGNLHECDWWSVTLGSQSGAQEEGAFCSKGFKVGVDWIHMASNNMTGTLPPELQYLTDLDLLYIHWNNIGGTIPGFFANMTSLGALSYRENRITGTIPEFLGNLTKLTHLYLSNNLLSGTIPSALVRLSSLKYLSLTGNRLTGTIPGSFGNLSNLSVLWLHKNMLNGTLPLALGSSEIHLEQNRLTGSIPSSFGNLTNIHYLSLYLNMINGTIPTEIGRLPNLEYLYLGENILTGPIPESFGSLTKLYGLGLGENMLSGTLPSELGRLSSLGLLYLDTNSLTGTISESFGNLTSLWDLRMQDNMLNGTLPSALGCLSNLQILLLDRNSFTGTIPSSLGRLSSLEYLYLFSNRFTGTIPDEVCQRRNSGFLDLWVDSLAANGTEFSCKCFNIEEMPGCCVPNPDEVGNGLCNAWEGNPPNTAACGWDGGDCLIKSLPECLGVFPSKVGDGWCDDYDPYNTEACGYDGGDCCEETCEDGPYTCGSNGYNCKNITSSNDI